MSGASDRIALAIGDPNGVGPEIAVRAAISSAVASPLLVGDVHVIRHYAAALAPGFDVRSNDGSAPARAGVIDVSPVEALAPADFAPGRVDAAAGRATVASGGNTPRMP